MTSRERVKRAIYFQDPDRIPYNFDSNRTPIDGISYGEDFIWTFVTQRAPTHGNNEWGVVYETIDESFGEPKVFPLEGRDTLEGYTFPDFSEDWRYEEMRRIVRENAGEKYVLGYSPVSLFQQMIDLFGFEGFMVNCIAEPEFQAETCDVLCDMAIACAEKMAEAGADGILLADDTALQNSLMVSMEVFNTIFKPRYARLFSHCRELGLDVFVHSCGYTLDIIEELIDAGCQVINLDQQDNMGLWEISRRYKGRITFFCPLDIQRTLELSPEEIEQRVKDMISAFSTEHGGFIAKTYPQPRAIAMSDAYLKTMTDAFKNHGAYNHA